jgi:hypothetical protein
MSLLCSMIKARLESNISLMELDSSACLDRKDVDSKYCRGNSRSFATSWTERLPPCNSSTIGHRSGVGAGLSGFCKRYG